MPAPSEAKRPTYPPKELSDQALGWIVRLHSGEADKADWAAFDAWRGQSAEHEAAAREAEMLWGDVSELHRDPVTGLIQPGRRKGGVSRRGVLGGVAGLAAVGAAGMWARGASRSWQSDHATGIAETRLVTLADGSRVTLNAMTAIDVDYRPDLRRLVLLEGQAFFEVLSDHDRPFVVETDRSRVLALGTAFDIDASLPDGSVAVAVTQHSVHVQPRGTTAGASPAGDGIVVAEGERVVISPDGRVGGVGRQEAAVATAWQTGMYVAEERRLDEVIAAFRAYHAGWIVVQGDGVRALRVNAVLDLRTPDASLHALAEGLPIRVRQVSRYLTVITAS